jgi:hypothetical protein
MKPIACLGVVLLTAGLAFGGVQRRIVVYSDPPGALVYVNNQYVGATPADYYYVYYGKYQITLVKDGYETLNVLQDIAAPWWGLPGIDAITEVQPFKLRDIRSFCYTLQPMQQVRPDDLLERATALRTRGQGIGTPREPKPLPAPVAPAAPAAPPLGPPVPPAIMPAVPTGAGPARTSPAPANGP